MDHDALKSTLLYRRESGLAAHAEEDWTLNFDAERNQLRVLHRAAQPGDENRSRFETVRDLDIAGFLNEDPEHPAARRLHELLGKLFE